jgi:hypothetical protein
METSRRFVRFVVPYRDEVTGCATGIFHVQTLCRRSDLSPRARQGIRQAFAWYAVELPVPPVVKRRKKALSWFRREPESPSDTEAREPLRRAFLLASALRRWGVEVETVQTDDPGQVLYEDRWQVVAVPQRHTPTGRAPYENPGFLRIERLVSS